MNEAPIATRIAELKANYQAGQAQLRKLDAQQRELEHTLLRISGAIQVLEEMLQDLRHEREHARPPEPVTAQHEAASPAALANGHA
ncbi:hypothetical protein WL40_04970 [Burkholderia ubonensis]|uniref:ATPase n=1 Tax=Burkholderia ubonensis TaxID=101571 RepID=A0ABD4E1W1_9BURK|nr:hypothetical protein [Burkholderia ubonensis]KVH81825.1 hypothetical protein WJ41_27445 [Burkholderia ubonensis]KVM16991.1 hypothetical protein WJ52_12940 [Burkholderia ubonensis]KVM18821.1 hypothetical protein WJ51_07145 [Burkholderia ubonensis]KVM42243.1 hypothetical protein WJ56_30645 [Burkholderia ubonensis]KVN85807.1 hypothetical protein WJ68_12420 [Burkholderia ubonensis]